MWLTLLCGKPPPPSSMPAMYIVPLPDMSPVIWVLRMKVAVLLTVIGACHVAPLSVEKVTWRAPLPTAKLFQDTYIRPKKGDAGLVSDQPDSRSSELPV